MHLKVKNKTLRKGCKRDQLKNQASPTHLRVKIVMSWKSLFSNTHLMDVVATAAHFFLSHCVLIVNKGNKVQHFSNIRHLEASEVMIGNFHVK